MHKPLQVTFSNIPPSDAVRERIKERVEKLETHIEGLISCRVFISAPHRHSQKGGLFEIKVVIALPGHEIVISRHPQEHQAHEDVYVAIRDAFDAAERRLEDYVRKTRGQVKRHLNVPEINSIPS